MYTDNYFNRFELAPEVAEALKKCKCIAYAETKEELQEMAYGPTHTSRYDVVYPIEGNGTVKEAEVVRCKNGCVVNFMEDYMRRRDPQDLRQSPGLRRNLFSPPRQNVRNLRLPDLRLNPSVFPPLGIFSSFPFSFIMNEEAEPRRPKLP